jgi:hypothetical protein
MLKSGVGVEKVPQQNALSSASMPSPGYSSQVDTRTNVLLRQEPNMQEDEEEDDREKEDDDDGDTDDGLLGVTIETVV